MIFLQLLFLIFLLGFIFWVCSHLYSSIFYVPYVNSSKKAILDALNLAKLKRGDIFIDLGCGRGDAIIMASRYFSAKSYGYEISPFPYLLTKIRIYFLGLSKNCHVIFGDFFQAEARLEEADVVYLYLFNSTLRKIEKWFFGHIGKKTKVVTLSFNFYKHKPIQKNKTKNLGQKTTISLYMKSK